MLESIQKNVAWSAIPIAGLAAGTAFLITHWILTPIMLDIKPVLALRYFASLVLGEGSLMEDTTGNLILGIVVHYVLSIFFTLIIAFVVHRWGLLVGIIGGALLGLSFYLINFYTMTLIFDWMFALHSNVLLISHIVFGAVAGGIYEMLDHYDMPLREVH